MPRSYRKNRRRRGSVDERTETILQYGRAESARAGFLLAIHPPTDDEIAAAEAACTGDEGEQFHERLNALKRRDRDAQV
jgi:hypothetical protein